MRVYQPFIRSLWRFLVCVKQNGGIIPAVLFLRKKIERNHIAVTPLLQNIAVFLYNTDPVKQIAVGFPLPGFVGGLTPDGWLKRLPVYVFRITIQQGLTAGEAIIAQKTKDVNKKQKKTPHSVPFSCCSAFNGSKRSFH